MVDAPPLAARMLAARWQIGYFSMIFGLRWWMGPAEVRQIAVRRLPPSPVLLKRAEWDRAYPPQCVGASVNTRVRACVALWLVVWVPVGGADEAKGWSGIEVGHVCAQCLSVPAFRSHVCGRRLRGLSLRLRSARERVCMLRACGPARARAHIGMCADVWPVCNECWGWQAYLRSKDDGVRWLFCEEIGRKASGGVYYWSYIYYLSKYIEFIDTLFKVGFVLGLCSLRGC
jgi:hypothetical protein